MPQKPNRPCVIRGCPNLAEPNSPRCKFHPRKERWSEGMKGRPMPHGWKSKRAKVLQRDPICRLQYEGICAGFATEADHIIPNAGDDPSNLQGVCGPCHKVKTQREAMSGRKLR